MGRCWQIFPCKGNIYCQHADEQIWHSFSLLFLVLVYCRPMSTQIIVQTDVVQAIFSRVLMAARAVRRDVTRERFNCSCPPCFQGKYCEIGRHDLFLLV